MKHWITLFWGVLLGGCALMPAPSVSPAQPESLPFAMNGRVSVNHGGVKHAAGLRWIHQLQSDEILLLAPLGQTVARIYRDARGATLDSGGEHYQAEDVEALMQQVLGWHLPLNGLHHWVLGMADPATPVKIERDESGRISLLSQDGWEVRYLRYAEKLPSRMQLIHEDLQVQMLMDEWDWNPQ